MKRINRFIMITVTLLVVVIFSACGDQVDQEEASDTKTIEVAHVYGSDHSINKALEEKFKPIIEEKSDGALEVEIYGDSKLGDEKEIISSAKNGSIQMVVNGTIVGDEVPRVNVPALPFLFDSYTEAQEILNGPIGKNIGENFESNMNLHLLGFGTTGFRHFISNTPVRDIEDFEGLKTRMADGYPITKKEFELLGTNMTPLAFSEVYSAIETGVVDAQEQPISAIISQQFYEVQDYVTLIKHSFGPQLFEMNNDFWESLSDDEQEIVNNAMDETLDLQWELLVESEEEDIEFLKNKGLEIIEPDEEFMNNLKEKTEPVYDFWYEKYPETKELTEKIRSEIDK